MHTEVTPSLTLDKQTPLQCQLYLNLCLSAWQLLNPYSARSSCHRCIKALELGHFQVTGKYDVIIYIPSSTEWGSFLSLEESCLSAMSLTEIIQDHHLFGRKGMGSSQKKPQAKAEATGHCTTRLHMDLSTVAPEEWLLQQEGHKCSVVGCRVPWVLPRGRCPWGRTHLLIPAQASQQRGAPCRSAHNRNRNCRAALAARTYLFACTLLWACITNSCSLPHRKTGDCSTK